MHSIVDIDIVDGWAWFWNATIRQPSSFFLSLGCFDRLIDL